MESFGVFKDLVTTNYFNFTGRSSRRAYWLFVLWSLIILGFINVIFLLLTVFIGETGMIFLGIFNLIFLLYTYIPGLALTFRRLHDLNYSFWFILIPFFNIFLLILCYFVRGTEGPNNFGDDPTNLPLGTTK